MRVRFDTQVSCIPKNFNLVTFPKNEIEAQRRVLSHTRIISTCVVDSVIATQIGFTSLTIISLFSSLLFSKKIESSYELQSETWKEL